MVEKYGKPIVLITGVSGYLGSHVANVFLKDGSYEVRGTVRDAKNQKKIAPLRKAFGDLFKDLTLVEADLLNEKSIIDAIAGATFVVHTASPFPLKNPKDEMEIIRPAVAGTTAVMRGCQLHKVKRVVITSSVAAVMELAPADKPLDGVYNETMWSNPIGDHIKAYSKSKTLAEQAAWDFQKNLPANERFEIVTINPGLIMGPAFVDAGFSSGDIIAKLMNNEYPGMPVIMMPIVDVRETAMAHLLAL